MKRRGLTLIELLVEIAVIGILVGLLLAAVQKVRAAANRSDCQNRMRQLALGLHQYHHSNHRLPPGMTFQPRFPPKWFLAGWQVHLLPYVEQDALYAQAAEDYRSQPFPAGPPPHRGLSTVVKTYICPADPRVQSAQFSPRDQLTVAFTSYLGVSGQDSLIQNGVLYRDSATNFAEVSDGLSSTLLLGERPPSADFHYGFWYAGRGQDNSGSAEMIMGVREANLQPITVGSPCGPGVYSYKPATGFDDPCGMFHFWSPHPGGANFGLADGSVRFIAYSANDIMPALASRAGGEVVTVP